MKNEYYRMFKIATSKQDTIAWFTAREALVKRYSWAIPDQRALDVIAKYTPIVEMGAGLGYWAFLLRQREVKIEAYDNMEYRHNNKNKAWARVKRGGPLILGKYPSRTLFLCWPPYATTMAEICLQNYKGKTVIYIGESNGGCTATNEFYEHLEAEFECIKTINIPQWFGLHDYMSIWKRKDSP